MTSIASPPSATPPPSTGRSTPLSPHGRRGHARREHRRSQGRRVLGRYVDSQGRRREVLAKGGAGGSVLVVDRDASTHDDCRLVAHLGADEPPQNAAIVCRCYLTDAQRGRCRTVTPADVRVLPFAGDGDGDGESRFGDAPDACEASPRDRCGRVYRLELIHTGMSIPELRWRRYASPAVHSQAELVSMREVVACQESYEPILTMTRRALARHRGEREVSSAVLRVELERVQHSPIVLNRGLREAALSAADQQGLSMSEIAIRCGRVKRDCNGNESGETSWLARRLGILPESGRDTPTPWIHSDVLALIARSGLGISPYEVEVE